jgi:hypothetical protein
MNESSENVNMILNHPTEPSPTSSFFLPRSSEPSFTEHEATNLCYPGVLLRIGFVASFPMRVSGMVLVRRVPRQDVTGSVAEEDTAEEIPTP